MKITYLSFEPAFHFTQIEINIPIVTYIINKICRYPDCQFPRSSVSAVSLGKTPWQHQLNIEYIYILISVWWGLPELQGVPWFLKSCKKQELNRITPTPNTTSMYNEQMKQCSYVRNFPLFHNSTKLRPYFKSITDNFFLISQWVVTNNGTKAYKPIHT